MPIRELSDEALKNHLAQLLERYHHLKINTESTMLISETAEWIEEAESELERRDLQ